MPGRTRPYTSAARGFRAGGLLPVRSSSTVHTALALSWWCRTGSKNKPRVASLGGHVGGIHRTSDGMRNDPPGGERREARQGSTSSY
eukprot:3608928-Prymnesium_polylepis.1